MLIKKQLLQKMTVQKNSQKKVRFRVEHELKPRRTVFLKKLSSTQMIYFCAVFTWVVLISYQYFLYILFQLKRRKIYHLPDLVELFKSHFHIDLLKLHRASPKLPKKKRLEANQSHCFFWLHDETGVSFITQPGLNCSATKLKVLLLCFLQWLVKMAAAGRTTKTDNTDAVDMEEMNPLWLKDKGR